MILFLTIIALIIMVIGLICCVQVTEYKLKKTIAKLEDRIASLEQMYIGGK